VGAIALPILFLIIFGSGLSRTMGMLAPGVDFTKFMYPGIIGMTVLMTSLMSAVSIVWDREFGFLREVLVAPVSRASVVMGKALGGATVAMLQGTIILLLAPIFGIPLSLLFVLKLWGLMLLVAWALGGLGILIASRMRSMEAFQIVMQMLVFPMVFLSGVFFPVGNLPAWLNVIVKINPATYGVDAIRQFMLGRILPQGIPAVAEMSPLELTLFGHTMSLANDLLVIAGFGVLTVTLAMWSFGRQE
jgi:ABC-2 type transport system permease protein